MRGLSVGADDLTDAPNFGTKFGRQRPCLRYGVPLPRPPQGDNHPMSVQNYRAVNNLVFRKAKGPESAQDTPLRAFVPVLTSFVMESPVTRDGFQRKGRCPSFGRFKVGLGGKSKSLPEFFFGGLGVYSFNLKRIHPQMPPSILGTPGWSTGRGTPSRRALRSAAGAGVPRGLTLPVL